jgi:hypothetical protein
MRRLAEFKRLFEKFGWRAVGLATVFVIHFVCFYWWVSDSYYFSGDGLFYFSRRITSFSGLWSTLVSLDQLYQYRPLPYVLFSFVLYPLFGTNPGPYHLAAYLSALINILLVCGCCYFWLCRDKKRALIASLFLILNPVNFFPSYGLGYIDVLMSLFFYFLALILILSNARWASVLAPALAALALLSREHSVLLPMQALLILVATGVPLGQAVSRTRNVWLVVAAYVVFQLIIRQGLVFAPEHSNPNLQFHFSLERVQVLLKGMKPAIYFPESPFLGAVQDYRRVVRLAFVIPWLGMILWVLFRRDKVALSGLIWIPLSLLPVAFIRFPPFPRHYYMALSGLAVVLASVLRNTRVMAYVTAIFALVTVTSVAMYAQDSWVTVGSRLTVSYFQEIQSIFQRSGRPNFYVLNEGDPNIYWHIDGGTALDQLLNKNIFFRFRSQGQGLQMASLLANAVNVVIPASGGFQDAFGTGRFPQLRANRLCDPISRLTDSKEDCAVFFRGYPVENTDTPVVETPDGMPVFDVKDETVMLSRTTVFLNGRSSIQFNATLRAAPESADGVDLQVYRAINGTFDRIFQRDIAPGEQIDLRQGFEGLPASMFVLRVGPGPNGDEKSDWLIWKAALP